MSYDSFFENIEIFTNIEDFRRLSDWALLAHSRRNSPDQSFLLFASSPASPFKPFAIAKVESLLTGLLGSVDLMTRNLGHADDEDSVSGSESDSRPRFWCLFAFESDFDLMCFSIIVYENSPFMLPTHLGAQQGDTTRVPGIHERYTLTKAAATFQHSNCLLCYIVKQPFPLLIDWPMSHRLHMSGATSRQSWMKQIWTRWDWNMKDVWTPTWGKTWPADWSDRAHLTTRLGEIRAKVVCFNHQDPVFHHHGLQPTANRLLLLVASYDKQEYWGPILTRTPTGQNYFWNFTSYLLSLG